MQIERKNQEKTRKKDGNREKVQKTNRKKRINENQTKKRNKERRISKKNTNVGEYTYYTCNLAAYLHMYMYPQILLITYHA